MTKSIELLVKIHSSGELIVQIRNFSPASLHATQKHFKSLPEVKSTRFFKVEAITLKPFYLVDPSLISGSL